jgi:hypothetical protein
MITESEVDRVVPNAMAQINAPSAPNLTTRSKNGAGREPSDMDGLAREGDLAGTERINAFHL